MQALAGGMGSEMGLEMRGLGWSRGLQAGAGRFRSRVGAWDVGCITYSIHREKLAGAQPLPGAKIPLLHHCLSSASSLLADCSPFLPTSASHLQQRVVLKHSELREEVGQGWALGGRAGMRQNRVRKKQGGGQHFGEGMKWGQGKRQQSSPWLDVSSGREFGCQRGSWSTGMPPPQGPALQECRVPQPPLCPGTLQPLALSPSRDGCNTTVPVRNCSGFHSCVSH